jgi:hypothetical protein
MPLVAQYNDTDRTASLGLTTLYAVPSNAGGIYRASCDLIVTQTGTAGYLYCGIQWHNCTAAQNVGGTLYELPLTSNGAEGGAPSPITFYACPSTNVSTYATMTGPTGSPHYAIRVRLEYLQ